MGELVSAATQFDASTPLGAIIDFVEEVKSQPQGRGEELVLLLSEGHPTYADRNANEVMRIRAYTMAALEQTGLPEIAMPFLMENLESSLHPYAVAAAARALRGANWSGSKTLDTLFRAIFNVWLSDRPVSFSAYHVEWPQSEVLSCLMEIFRTLAHFGEDAGDLLPRLECLAAYPEKFSDASITELLRTIETIRRLSASKMSSPRADTDAPRLDKYPHSKMAAAWVPFHLDLEDHDGNHLQWKDFYGHKPTVIGFFYTRCGNPYKCTRTIFNLARIQEEVVKRGLAGRVRISAISYDAQFDTPAALRSYGDARNFRFDDDCRMFRVPNGFERLVEQMGLEVSYDKCQVSSHRIELFALDGAGNIVQSYARLQSEPKEVTDALVSLL